MKFLPKDLIRYSKKSSPVIENVSEVVSEPEERLIDESVGMNYCSGNREFYMEALEMYEEAFAENELRLKRNFENKDWQDYSIVAHSIKSNSMMIGALKFSELAKSQEFAGRDCQEAQILSQFETFLADYRKVCEACRKIRQA